MPSALHAEIITPERALFRGEAEEVSLRTDRGEIAFLAHHTEFVGALDITLVTVMALPSGHDPHAQRAPGSAAEITSTPLRFAVHGGFVYVANNSVTVLAGVAERAEEVDVARARAALERASERFASEGVPTAPEGVAAHEGGGEALPLSGAALALLAPESAAEALRRAEVRLEAAGAGSEAR